MLDFPPDFKYKKMSETQRDPEVQLDGLRGMAKDLFDKIYEARRRNVMRAPRDRRWKDKFEVRVEDAGPGCLVVTFYGYDSVFDRTLYMDKRQFQYTIVINMKSGKVELEVEKASASRKKRERFYSADPGDHLDSGRQLLDDSGAMDDIHEYLVFVDEMLEEEMEGPALRRLRKHFRNVENLPSVSGPIKAVGGRVRDGVERALTCMTDVPAKIFEDIIK